MDSALTNQPEETSEAMARLGNIILCTLAVLLILAAPVLGLIAAAIGIWQALLAGSILFLPLGLVIVLAAISLIQSHKKGDLALLAVLASGIAGWFVLGALPRAEILEWTGSLATRLDLLSGLLVVLVLGLALIYALRLVPARATRIRLVLAGTPLILLVAASTSVASFIFRSY